MAREGEITVRPARPEDSAAIATIYRDSVDPWLAEVTALGSPVAARYLRLLIAQDGSGWSSRFWIAETAGQCAGFVQMRRASARTAFVNNIYVARLHRSRGVGPRLLLAAIDTLAEYDTIALDVFANNDRGRAWYERLGFSTQQRRAWWFAAEPLSPPPTGHDDHHVVESWPQACICHDAFGFSTFTLETARASYLVGRLGDGWWRIPGSPLLGDPAARLALHRLDAPRRVLMIVDAAQRDGLEGLERYDEADRMTVSRGELFARLSTRTRP